MERHELTPLLKACVEQEEEERSVKMIMNLVCELARSGSVTRPELLCLIEQCERSHGSYIHKVAFKEDVVVRNRFTDALLASLSERGDS